MPSSVSKTKLHRQNQQHPSATPPRRHVGYLFLLALSLASYCLFHSSLAESDYTPTGPNESKPKRSLGGWPIVARTTAKAFVTSAVQPLRTTFRGPLLSPKIAITASAAKDDAARLRLAAKEESAKQKINDAASVQQNTAYQEFGQWNSATSKRNTDNVKQSKSPEGMFAASMMLPETLHTSLRVAITLWSWLTMKLMDPPASVIEGLLGRERETAIGDNLIRYFDSDPPSTSSSSLLKGDTRSKKRTLVFIHGFGSQKRTWLDTISHLLKLDSRFMEQHRLIMLDLPNHGNTAKLERGGSTSPKTAKDYTIERQAEDVAGFISAIVGDGTPKEDIVIVGHSMGGGISLELLASGKIASSGVLLSPFGIKGEAMSRGEKLHLVDGINPLLPHDGKQFAHLVDLALGSEGLAGDIGHNFLKWLAHLSVSEANQRAHDLFQWFYDRAGVAKKNKGLEVVAKGLQKIKEEDTYWTYDKLKSDKSLTRLDRLLVVWGREDGLIHPSGGEVLQRALPQNTKVVFLDKQGHVLTSEAPDKVAALILEHLESLPKRTTK